MKKYLIIGLLVLLGGLFFKNLALADIAPPTPAYPNTRLNVRVELSSLTDKYVVIRRSQHFADVYGVVADLYISPNGYGAETFFALDKNYFESSGGIDGLFSTEGFDDGVVMSPKDKENFNAHIYNFVIAKNDPLLDSEFGRMFDRHGDYAINDEYVSFPFQSDFYIREGADDSSCDTGFEGIKDCRVGEKTLTYVPQEVVDRNIILVNSESLNGQNSVSAPQSEVTTPVQELSWWQKIWNFIKSLF